MPQREDGRLSESDGGSGAVRVMGRVAVVFVLCVAAARGGGATESGAAGTAVVDVVVSRGLVTARLRDAPLNAVLGALAARGDFVLVIDGKLARPVSWTMSDVPLDKAIARLVGVNGLVMLYATAGARRLREVSVYNGAARRASAFTNKFTPVPSDEPASTEDLAAVLAEETDFGLRRKAVIDLGQRAGPDAVAALAAALDGDDRLIRIQAARALGDMTGRDAAAVLSGVLDDPDPTLRRLAARGLGDMGGAGAVGVLGELLAGDPAAQVRREVARSLGWLGEATALWALERASTDPDETVRAAVDAALAEW
jgi:hypothetical protein